MQCNSSAEWQISKQNRVTEKPLYKQALQKVLKTEKCNQKMYIKHPTPSVA